MISTSFSLGSRLGLVFLLIALSWYLVAVRDGPESADTNIFDDMKDLRRLGGDMLAGAGSGSPSSGDKPAGSNAASPMMMDLDAAKKMTQELLSLIRARYELDGPIGSNFFLTANNMKAETWDIMKYKFLVKALDTTGMDKTFLMIFGGRYVNKTNRGFVECLELWLILIFCIVVMLYYYWCIRKP